MNQKQIGIVLIIAGVILASLVFFMKANEDRAIERMVMELGGTCYLSDGTCLHSDRDFTPYITGWILAGAIAILGVYLSIFDRTQKILEENQLKIADAIKTTKKEEKFEAFISGFDDEEKKVLRAVKEQDGILQSTLRFRTGIPKATLSIMIKELENKGIISKKPEGKTNKIFIRKTF
jgi:DNA-binding MarR family transcriptional regulator